MFGEFKNQYYTTVCLNLITLVQGIAVGWSSPIIPILESDETPLISGKLTETQVSWVVACYSFGAFIGTFVFGYTVDKYGRKKSMHIPAMTYILAWLFIILAKDAYYLYIGRILSGFAGTSAFIVIPIYVSEISDDKIRGTLGSFLMFIANTGVLLTFIVGIHMDYYWIPCIGIFFTILFMAVYLPIPESPSYLLSQDKYEDAEKAYRFFYNIKTDDDAAAMEKFVQAKEIHAKRKIIRKKFLNTKNAPKFDKATRRAIMITCVLILMTQMSGVFLILNYTTDVFEEAGSSLSPETSSIIVAIMQLFGAYLSTMLVDRVGRKILLKLSSIFTGISLVMLAIFFYRKTHNYRVTSLGWLPVASLSGAIFSSSWGISTIPFILAGEILPQRLRGLVLSKCLLLLWVVAFVLLKFYDNLTDRFGFHGCLGAFAGFCFFEAIFISYYLPETKGKDFSTIRKRLRERGDYL